MLQQHRAAFKLDACTKVATKPPPCLLSDFKCGADDIMRCAHQLRILGSLMPTPPQVVAPSSRQRSISLSGLPVASNAAGTAGADHSQGHDRSQLGSIQQARPTSQQSADENCIGTITLAPASPWDSCAAVSHAAHVQHDAAKAAACAQRIGTATDGRVSTPSVMGPDTPSALRVSASPACMPPPRPAAQVVQAGAKRTLSERDSTSIGQQRSIGSAHHSSDAGIALVIQTRRQGAPAPGGLQRRGSDESPGTGSSKRRQSIGALQPGSARHMEFGALAPWHNGSASAQVSQLCSRVDLRRRVAGMASVCSRCIGNWSICRPCNVCTARDQSRCAATPQLVPVIMSHLSMHF